MTLDTKLSRGIAGSVLPDPQCIPDATYFSPFEQVELPDIPDNRSLSVHYYYPRQLKPHRSHLLPGVRRSIRVLTSADFETLHRRGARGRGGRENGVPGWGGSSRGTFYGGSAHGGNTGYATGYDRERGGGYGYGSYGTSPATPYNNGGRGGYGQGYGAGSYGYGPQTSYTGPAYNGARGRGRGR